MRKKSVLSAAVAVCICLVSCETQPKEIPLVYDSERTYTLTAPYLPAYEDLPSVKTLPDHFAWTDGSGRSIRFEDWARRRAEIGAEIQRYEVGPKPGKPDAINARFENDTLYVNITVGDSTLTLNS